MPEIIVKAAGQTIPRVEKRAGESIVYTLNCAELLDKDELIVSAAEVADQEGLTISCIRPRKGKSVEIKVSNTDILTAVYIDYTISIAFSTVYNNTRYAVFSLRVYK